MSAPYSADSAIKQNTWFQRFKRFIADRIILVGFIVFSALSILAFLLLSVWLQVNLFWRTKEFEYRLRSVPLVASGSLEVSYPAVVLAGQELVTVTAALSTSVPLTETVMFTITPPNSLKLVAWLSSEAMPHTLTIKTAHLNNGQIVLGDSSVPITSTIPVSEQPAAMPILLPSAIIEFGPDTLPVQTFNLVNAQITHSGWWIFGARPEQCLNLISLYLPKGKDELCLNVESVEGYSWRMFVNSAVDERNPLILFVVGLVSAAGAVLTYVFKKSQDDEENRRREDRDAQAQRTAQEEVFRLTQARETKAEQLRAAFHNCIKAKDLDGAQLVLGEFKNDSNLFKLVEAEWGLMEKLTSLATASVVTDITELVSATTTWPEACAHAYLMCHHRLYSRIPDKVREAGRLIPIERIRDDQLLAELTKVDRELYSRQSAKWLSVTGPPPSPLPASPSVLITKALDGRNPFAYERAEDDQEFLFGGGFRDEVSLGFWNQHPVFRALSISNRPYLVFGEPGSGKTATALAFGLYKLDLPARLALYLPGQPEIPEIVAGFAQQFLTFVKRTPTLLGDLSTDERMLLANLLAGSLGRAFVLADLTETQNSREWLREGSGDKEKRDWEQLGNAQLNLLKQAVQAAPASMPHESQWSREVVRCAASLTYKRDQVLLVIDGNGATPDWVNQMLALRIRQWWLSGVMTFMFLPGSIAGQVNVDNGVTDRLRLNWDNSPVDMNEMIRFRLEQVMQRNPIENLFEGEVLQEMVAASQNNPRRFIQLWGMCMPETEMKFTSAHLQRALQH